MFWKKKKVKPPKAKVVEDSGTENYFLKISLLGDGAVGKTNLRRNYLGVGFTSDHLMTIGADFAATERTFEINDKKYDVTFQIWDLAGQATFSQVRSMYYKGCFGGLLVFDRTRPSSFDNLMHWINEMEKNTGRGAVPIIVLGNKYDLIETADEVVDQDNIDKFISEINEKNAKNNFQIHYLDTSALTGKNVDKAFETLGVSVLNWLGVTKKAS
ncbi:MAG: Rab family GTPase [Candidatus Kariarchaeaceae archaeon]|jgi:small GTP-binding protein